MQAAELKHASSRTMEECKQQNYGSMQAANYGSMQVAEIWKHAQWRI